MTQNTVEEKESSKTDTNTAESPSVKKTAKWPFVLGIIGIVLTLLMCAAIIYYNDELQSMQQYGYIGAFFISILGGATVIIPVPMLAVVFALGGAMRDPWHVAIVGLSAALGELVGALTIYMTGHGAGRAISFSKHGRLQRAYERMLDLMERRGAIALFAVTSVVNPFFYPAAFACGALRLGLKKYIPIVLVGKLIKCMTVVYAGYYGFKGIFRALGLDV